MKNTSQTAFRTIPASTHHTREAREMGKKIFIFMIMALALARCRDTETFVPDPQAVKFNSSAFIEVRDVSGVPMEGVKITLGNRVEDTNNDGIAYFKEVTMEKSTYVTANKAGFFHGSRRFYPIPKQTQFVRIVLLPSTSVGTIQSAAGGMITIHNGTTLDFPANAIMDQNGNSYEGTVNVTAQPIAAGDPDLSYKMPGDLVGKNTEGEEQCLGSLGMVVVELRSSTGNLLQVKTGSKVGLHVEVPAQLIGHAPSTIPMWYFDEAQGFWKEEGNASLEGNAYVTEVGHFSYWNCDAGFPTFKWGASFVYEDGSPASQVEVCITILSLETTRCAYTNEQGVVCGLVASGELLLMEVKSPCGDILLSQQIGPFSDTTMLGPITIPSTTVSFSAISGNAVDCDGNPVTNGFVKIAINGQNYYTGLDSITGAFSLSAMNCDESDVTVTAIDISALKQSLPQIYNYAPVINAGTIAVCETLTEYIDIEVAGFTDHIFYFLPSTGIQGAITRITAADSVGNTSKYFYVSFEGVVPGTYTPTGFEIGFELPPMIFVQATAVTIQVTYYGGPGDYIQGNLSGTVNTGPNAGNIEYPFTGTFSVKRE
ncbi:MAG: hypothetical protein ABIQ02_00510 [Saprospiraceae bacterium]